MINTMTEDIGGGVCLIKEYSYFTYEQSLTDCVCVDNLIHKNTYLPMGIYIKPYQNTNLNYSPNISDSTYLSVESLSVFIQSYISDLVTTGYTSYDDSGFENRIIFDQGMNKYYYFENTLNSLNCLLNNEPIWAVVDHNGELFISGDYFYKELDGCNVETGNNFIYLSDINPSSVTYGQTQTILKCPAS